MCAMLIILKNFHFVLLTLLLHGFYYVLRMLKSTWIML